MQNGGPGDDLPETGGVQLHHGGSEAALCTLCGHTAAERDLVYARCSNTEGEVRQRYRVYRCRRCGAAFTSPRPKGPERAALHQTGVYARRPDVGEGGASRLLNFVQDLRLRAIGPPLRPSARLLDVGCGKGRFLRRAARSGWDSCGVEISASQFGVARERGHARVVLGELSDLGSVGAVFDVVTAWHVLEHAPETDRMLEEVRQVLRPGGLFALEVPNWSSWQSRLGDSRWFQLDVPRHVTHFTPKALRGLLNRHKFRVVRGGTFSLELGPFGMLQSALNRIAGRPNTLFRWLKSRRSCGDTVLHLVAQMAFASLLAVPAVLLELLSCVFGAGGVIWYMAVLERH